MRTLALTAALVVLAGCTTPSTDSPDAAPDTTQAAPEATTAASSTIVPLNLNTASQDEFKTIPNVGDRMAHEFEEYRPYTSIEQFRREIGKYVDAEQVAAYEPYVFVPIDPNASDAATVAQLPGLDAASAEALVAGRPYATPDAFLDAYVAAVPGSDRTAAARYLTTP